MVSRSFLDERSAMAVNPVSRADIEADLRARLIEGLPGWQANSDTILGQALPLIADAIWTWIEMVNRNWQNGTLVHASGVYLDEFAIQSGIRRSPGESDADLRFRIANAPSLTGLGSVAGIEAQARNFNSEIDDAQAVVASNNQNVAVYALKSDQTALTTEEATALRTHLNARGNKIAGVTITTPSVTATPFTVAVNISHAAEYSSDTIAADARAAIYQWLAGAQRIGAGIYRLQIQAAALVDGAATVAITAPAADQAPTDGTVYTCAANDTDVTVNTTRLS